MQDLKPILIFYVLLLLFTTGVWNNGFAQSGQVEDKDVVVEKERAIDLPTQIKIIDKILPETIQQKDKAQIYNLSTPEYMPEYLRIPVNPPKENSEALPLIVESKAEGYIKLGGGNYNTTYGEGFFEHKVSRKFYYGLQARHLASFIGPVGSNDYAATNENKLRIHTDYLTQKSKFSFIAAYQRNSYRFYGYAFDENNSFNGLDSMKQILNKLTIEIRHNNLQIDQKFQYNYGIDYTYFQDNSNNKEGQFNIQGDLSYQLSESIKIKANLQAWLSQLNQDTLSINRNLFALTPVFNFKYNRIELNAGVNITYNNDTSKTGGPLHVFPILNISYRFADLLAVTLGYEGAVELTSLSRFDKENPYLKNSAIRLFHSNKLFELFAKIQGNILPKLYYSAKIQYSQYKNLYFYRNIPNDSAKFEIIYNNDVTKLFKIEGQIGYQIKKNLNTRFRIAFLDYSLPGNGVAFHRANLESNLLVSYQPVKNLSLSLDFYVTGGIRTFNFRTNETVSLPTIYDLNFKADYTFYKKLSAFAMLNNLFSQDYQRYLNYPNQGFNFLIGLGYAF